MIPELIIAITLASEAIGESLYGKQMVASVIVNRMNERKMEAADVCLQKKQFSWWNRIKPEQNLEWMIERWRLLSPEEWADCMELAVKVKNGRFVPIAYVNHYYNPDKCCPRWADQLTNVRKVGNHIFGLLKTQKQTNYK